MASAPDISSEPSLPSSPQVTHLQTLEPSAPAPDSTRLEVETYFTAYFRYSQSLTKEAALEKAKQFPVDGQTLYRQSDAKLQAVFGPTGGALYDDIHTSSYGMYYDVCNTFSTVLPRLKRLVSYTPFRYSQHNSGTPPRSNT